MIKAIIFDCFGVLATDTWAAFLDSLPSGVDVVAVRDTHRAYTTGLIDKQTCARHIKQLTGQTFVEAEDRNGGEVAKNTLLLEYIRSLSKRGYKLGILSNIGSNWLRESFLTEEEQALFDTITLSFECGMVKPDPRIFQLTWESLGMKADQTIMVDDIASYCQAARTLGMKAVLYEDFQQTKRDIQRLLAE